MDALERLGLAACGSCCLSPASTAKLPWLPRSGPTATSHATTGAATSDIAAQTAAIASRCGPLARFVIERLRGQRVREQSAPQDADAPLSLPSSARADPPAQRWTVSNLLPALRGESALQSGGAPVRDHLVGRSCLGVFSLRTSERAGYWKLDRRAAITPATWRAATLAGAIARGPVPGCPGQLYHMVQDPWEVYKLLFRDNPEVVRDLQP